MTALFTALAIGFSIGAGVLISQYFGANRLEELRRYAASSIVLMLLLGLLMSVIGFCSAELLLARFLSTPQALLPQAALHRHPLLQSPWKRTTAIMAITTS